MRRVFGFARLPNTNAFLAVGLDEAEMLRRVDREMRMAYIQFALIGAFVLFGVWFGGEHAIVRPLRALARMAMHVGHGNLQIRTTRRRWAAEFVPLAGALDAMAQRLTEREDELRVANAHLERLARHDSLSGLANRRSFDLKLEEEWRSSARSNAPLALIMIDIDHFKMFNDHYGHLAGDACLRAGESLADRGPQGRSWRVMAARNSRCCSPEASRERALAWRKTCGPRSRSLDLRTRRPRGHVTASVGVASLRAAAHEPADADRGRRRGPLRRQAPRPQHGRRAGTDALAATG